VTKVGFLGLGIMGSGMAQRLVAAGFDVAVWNRDPAKTEALGKAGARVAATPAAAAAGADVVVAMIANDDAARQVWLGPDGALAALTPGAIAIEASTLTLGWIREFAAAAAECGVGFLDAPVTGSKVNAAEGTVKFLVGGDETVLDRARPVLAAMSTDVIHLGPVGSGALMKLINNFVCGVQVASLAESLTVIEAAGMDVAQAMGVLLNGAPGSPLLKTVSQRMINRDYAPNFLAPLMAKDLQYAREAFAEWGVDLKTATAARERFVAAAEGGFADKDIASIVEILRVDAGSLRG
jgi:3-hydroxyisobutyrate dehydrogenase